MNPRNIFSTTVLCAGIGAALGTPLASIAHDSTPMDACLAAFVARSFPPEQPINLRKIDPTRNRRETSARTVEILIKAHESRTGRQVASATCVAEHDGTIIALETQRADGSATLASAERKTARNR